jgi:ComF family protein
MFKRVGAAWRRCFLASLVEEHCRLCGAYIDILLSSRKSQDSDHSLSICQSCLELIRPDEAMVSYLPLCRQSVNLASGWGGELMVASGIDYRESMKKLVRRFKYDKDILLTKDLSEILANAWKAIEPVARTGETILVPIPLHWRREFERGYNQAALVAVELSRQEKIRVVPRALVRKKATRPQNKLSKEGRERNLVDAFRGNRRLLTGKVVVLVDDVCTSGATLAECANEAYRCGAKAVFGLTVARAVLRHSERCSTWI